MKILPIVTCIIKSECRLWFNVCKVYFEVFRQTQRAVWSKTTMRSADLYYKKLYHQMLRQMILSHTQYSAFEDEEYVTIDSHIAIQGVVTNMYCECVVLVWLWCRIYSGIVSRYFWLGDITEIATLKSYIYKMLAWRLKFNIIRYFSPRRAILYGDIVVSQCQASGVYLKRKWTYKFCVALKCYVTGRLLEKDIGLRMLKDFSVVEYLKRMNVWNILSLEYLHNRMSFVQNSFRTNREGMVAYGYIESQTRTQDDVSFDFDISSSALWYRDSGYLNVADFEGYQKTLEDTLISIGEESYYGSPSVKAYNEFGSMNARLQDYVREVQRVHNIQEDLCLELSKLSVLERVKRVRLAEELNLTIREDWLFYSRVMMLRKILYGTGLKGYAWDYRKF